MDLDALQRIKKWHVAHQQDHPVEYHILDAMLVLWVMGWVGWDSSWYMRIAEEGYRYTPGEQSSVAFFPVYPLAIRAVEALGPDVYQAGVLVTLLCGPLAILLFLRWARCRVEEPLALQAA